MTARLGAAISDWELRHPCNEWHTMPTGLAVYAAFTRTYGFRVHGGFGWERVHTLDFATQLQDNRKHGGNWKRLWRDRCYAL